MAALRAGATALDERIVAPVALRFERPSLILLTFHHIFESRAEIESGLVLPQEAVTLAGFRRVVDHLAEAGYRFVSLADVVNGIRSSGRLASLTFDDGNASNLRALDLLHEYAIPTSILVITRRVENGRKCWWDVLYYERRKRGTSDYELLTEIQLLERMGARKIEQYLGREFGSDASTPRAEIDRPLSRRELVDLATVDVVTIGNHTVDHVALSTIGRTEVRDQLLEAQGYLEEATGSAPFAVAYPYGVYNAQVVDVAREFGFACGLTTRRLKVRPPVVGGRPLELGRFQLDGNRDLDAQLRVIRSDVQLANTARRVLRRRPD